MLNKAPEVTRYFWTIKILCTTVGETESDYLAGYLQLGLTKANQSYDPPVPTIRARSSAKVTS
jgi:uncharacterized membrane-anchored protein